MTWVKVCGLSRLRDVRVAEDAGADAFGLVLAADSPRRVTADEASELVRSAAIPAFLVTVDATPSELLDLARWTGASGVQPHGRHAAEASQAAVTAGFRVLRPLSAEPDLDLSKIPAGQIPLIDTPDPQRHGGTGRMFDPAWAPGTGRPWVMAGGLGPANVSDAIATVDCWGVDASSRLESSPGTKDPELIRAFVSHAKNPGRSQ